eukprot:SAG22_NODE_125_length_18883_cov_12.351629_15_plen_132_part_00
MTAYALVGGPRLQTHRRLAAQFFLGRLGLGDLLALARDVGEREIARFLVPTPKRDAASKLQAQRDWKSDGSICTKLGLHAAKATDIFGSATAMRKLTQPSVLKTTHSCQPPEQHVCNNMLQRITTGRVLMG